MSTPGSSPRSILAVEVMNQTEVARGLRRAHRCGWAALAVFGGVILFGVFAQDAWPATLGRTVSLGGIMLGSGLAGYAAPLAASLRRERSRLMREEYRRLAK